MRDPFAPARKGDTPATSIDKAGFDSDRIKGNDAIVKRGGRTGVTDIISFKEVSRDAERSALPSRSAPSRG